MGHIVGAHSLLLIFLNFPQCLAQAWTKEPVRGRNKIPLAYTKIYQLYKSFFNQSERWVSGRSLELA